MLEPKKSPYRDGSKKIIRQGDFVFWKDKHIWFTGTVVVRPDTGDWAVEVFGTNANGFHELRASLAIPQGVYAPEFPNGCQVVGNMKDGITNRKIMKKYGLIETTKAEYLDKLRNRFTKDKTNEFNQQEYLERRVH
jgi:hypothetical protein